jgi:glucose/arabinose dehydrogenase
MHRRIATFTILLIAALIGVPPTAQAQSMSPAAEQAVRSYVLDQGKADVILKTLKEVTAETLKDPHWMTKLPARMKLPFEEQWKAMEADPASGPVLKANRISAREYSCGLLAMRAASGLDSGAGLKQYANPANVAFLKANPSIVERLSTIDMGK